MLERMSVDSCCVQDARFRERSVKMINRKAAHYKPFWIQNKNGLRGTDISLATKWVNGQKLTLEVEN